MVPLSMLRMQLCYVKPWIVLSEIKFSLMIEYTLRKHAGESKLKNCGKQIPLITAEEIVTICTMDINGMKTLHISEVKRWPFYHLTWFQTSLPLAALLLPRVIIACRFKGVATFRAPLLPS